MVVEELQPIKTKKSEPNPPANPLKWYFFALLLGLVIYTIYDILRFDDVVRIDDKGKPQIIDDRRRKLDDDTLRFYRSAEQYALVATRNDWYDCMSCVDSSRIFLHIGEIWKYGVTINGEQVRYTKNELIEKGLLYLPQLQGSLQRCLSEERKKIIEYPLLPENLTRKPEYRLARPPANPYDT
ncbi:MAG: hypothetical protein MUE81_12510 [Thermoflexibacter sp.]|jgi:hypothetical protein|nr:hypothetical protein [Thermoflexibacter sp.]